MKTIDGPSIKKVLSLLILMVLIIFSGIVYYRYAVYNSIQVSIKKNAIIEYGSANYDINDYIKKIEGEIVSIKNDIDTNVVGEHEVIVEVEKDSVKKEVPIVLSVIDTVLPTIEIKEEKVTIESGTNYDFTSNILMVKDDVDGELGYASEVYDESVLFYHFDYDASSIQNVGEHEVKVYALDKNKNRSEKSFILQVVAPKPAYSSYIYHNLPANVSGEQMVSIARGFLGYPYVAFGNSPAGFDCSGFVQYVYSQVGMSVSRSSSTQIHDGVAVPYDEAKPGDILSWGYFSGAVTHSALYIGNGQMIHAANPGMGVILSDVSYWQERSGTQLLSVRRVL